MSESHQYERFVIEFVDKAIVAYAQLIETLERGPRSARC